MIEIIQYGIYTSIQDMGRFNYQSYGVPVSGALDQQAYRIANQILNNPPTSAVLEFTIKGPKIRFHQNTFIALTGAKMKAKLNGVELDYFAPIKVNEGSILEIGIIQNGCRTYLAVCGGIKTEKILESRSQFKGVTINDRIFKKTLLPIDNPIFNPSKGARMISPSQDYSQIELEVYTGPEFYKLSKIEKENLFSTLFTISKFNNRMAVRLKEKFKNEMSEIWTAPVIPGIVQCTSDGSLIILMRDAQVTGGYPRILQLNNSSLNLLSQKNTEDKIRFKLLSRID